MKRLRICIIGAGASGLACARVMASDEYQFEPTIFEQNSFFGGQWHFDPTGTSKSSAVYHDLRTNLPCSVMQFSDFPFSNSDPDAFVSHHEMDDYLVKFVEHFQLEKYIQYNTTVVDVDETFTVTYQVRDAVEQRANRVNQIFIEKCEHLTTYKEQFDAVCIANGHYSEIYIPDDIPGLRQHRFPIYHSQTYRSAEPFRDQCVVVVGASHSGLDISGELLLVAKQVILSMREESREYAEVVLRLLRLSEKQVCTDYLDTKFSIVSPIDRIENEIVYFKDKKSIQPDVILFATGYEYSFPFLKGKLQVNQDRYVYPLYKQLFHADFRQGQLSFLTIPYRIVPFPLAELQSHLIARVLSGQIHLPSRDEMMKDIDHPSLPRNRAYHVVKAVDYTKDLLKLMEETDQFYKYYFTVDSERRIRKMNQ
jgi:thioredoxin reductase